MGYVLFFILLYIVYFLPDVLLDFILGNQDVVYKNKNGAITFTFDDSPSEYTNDILDCLKQHDIKAIFFVHSDNVAGNEETIDRMVKEGHTLGNHGTKDEVHVLMHPSVFENDLMECHNTLQRWTDHPTYFRPGFGFFNPSMLATLQKHGYTLMLGNVFPYDALIKSPTVNAWFVQRKLKQGSVVILHDRAWTLPTLQMLFDRVHEQLVP